MWIYEYVRRSNGNRYSFLYPDNYVDIRICSAKNETDTFLFPDDYVDGLDMFGEERNRYLFVSG